MTAPRYLTDLTRQQARWLTACANGPVLINGPIPAVTVEALKRKQLIQEGRDRRARPVWQPTLAGHELLRAHEPRLLAVRSELAYTSDLSRALPGEPEAITAADLDHYTAQARERDHARTVEHLQLDAADAVLNHIEANDPHGLHSRDIRVARHALRQIKQRPA